MKLNIDFIYPVGSLYMTTSSVSPETLFGGKWTQITSDAYLKIVTTNAGSLGGTSSSHRIPISSMPSHTHNYTWFDGNITTTDQVAGGGIIYTSNPVIHITGSAGGNQPYYPYYYGIYLWKRTA